MVDKRASHVVTLACPQRGAGAQQNRALRENQRGILDKNRIGIRLERVQDIDGQAQIAQRRDIGTVFRDDAVVGGRCVQIGAQAMHHAFSRRACDGVGEVKGVRHAGQFDPARDGAQNEKAPGCFRGPPRREGGAKQQKTPPAISRGRGFR